MSGFFRKSVRTYGQAWIHRSPRFSRDQKLFTKCKFLFVSLVWFDMFTHPPKQVECVLHFHLAMTSGIIWNNATLHRLLYNPSLGIIVWHQLVFSKRPRAIAEISGMPWLRQVACYSQYVRTIQAMFRNRGGMGEHGIFRRWLIFVNMFSRLIYIIARSHPRIHV